MHKEFLSRLDFIRKLKLKNTDIDRLVDGVYTENDLLHPITYAEFAYWLILSNIVKPVLSYYKVSEIAEDLGFDMYMVKENGELTTDIVSYKMSPDMESYLETIIKGYRYSPVIFVHAYLNFIEVFELKESLCLGDLYKRVDQVELF